MGNSNGGLADYFAAFRQHDALQGGFIWEWVDHGIRQRDTRGREYWAYGGDFGDTPNDANFCADGIVWPDRTPHPALHELKFLAQPVHVEARGGGRFRIHNRHHFASLDALPRRVGADRRRRAAQGRPPAGAARGAGRDARRRAAAAAPATASGSSPSASSCGRRTEWAPAGHEVAWQQLAAARTGGDGGSRPRRQSRARTACSRPAACARCSTSPRASCASSRSTGATCSSTDHGYSSGGRRPTTTACRRCRAGRADVLPRWLELGLDRLQLGVVSATRVDGSAVELVHRADGLVTPPSALPAARHRRAPGRERRGALAEAPRRAANRGRAHPPARPRAARLVRPRPVGGVLGPARVHRRRPLREHGHRSVRPLHPPARARPPSGHALADADRRRGLRPRGSRAGRRSDSGRATSPQPT